MKVFKQMEVTEAKAHAMAGGQALHLHRIIVDEKKAPRCFVNAVKRGEDIAHLFDQDYLRLMKTARSLGVKVILVEHKGTPRQHIDLCGKPLEKARGMAYAEDKFKAHFEGKPVTYGSGGPVVGKVSNVRVEGDKTLFDITDIDPARARLLQGKWTK